MFTIPTQRAGVCVVAPGDIMASHARAQGGAARHMIRLVIDAVLLNTLIRAMVPATSSRDITHA
jgi:hypothetical protein